MPRRTHPRLAAKHDRGHIRFQRDRKIAVRVARYRKLGWWPERIEREPWGRLANEDWWLGCHNPRCGICRSPEEPTRTRAKREWRAFEQLA